MTYEEILKKLVEEDERFIVMTAENRAAIRNLPNQIGDRFIDTGITEQTLVGSAAGLALRGRIPVIHALATFLTMRAFEFIRTDVGIGNLNVKIVGGFPGFLSDGNGATHQSIEDVSLMRGIPNINVWCPADEEDMLLGLETVLKDDRAFYIRYNNSKPAISHNKNFEIGKAEVISEGTDVAILVYGVLLAQAVEAKRILEEHGKSVRLINVRTPKPIDEEQVLKAARECKIIATVEDHFLTGGLYSIIAEIFLRNEITARVLPFALNNKWFKPVLMNDLLEYEGFTGRQIAEKILKNF
ncbi:MAG: transketolase [Ignavibacteria bacterium]|nr:transketolase [Ignavibacteria bacterium]